MNIHFISIGGVVMHNLAIALQNRGDKITGSDEEIYEPSRSRLEAQGLLPDKEGYDDNFVLDNENGDLKYIGCLKESNSGRIIEVLTTQPGMQVYTGFWNPEMEIDGAKKFGSFSGVALETQHYPDSVNRPEFPTTLLKPGETYNEKTIYKFITE